MGKGRRVKLNQGDELSLCVPSAASVTDNPNLASSFVAFIFQDKREESVQESQVAQGPGRVYDIRETLGTGNFAEVKLAVHRTTGERVAVKVSLLLVFLC